MYIQRFFRFAVLVGSLGCVASARAQMTDDQVIRYVQTELRNGKERARIGRELLARGVTREQLERLHERSASGLEGAGSLPAAASADPVRGTAPVAAVAATAEGGREVPARRFGANVFAEPALTFEPNGNLATPENYHLGPGDEVIIEIWGANEDTVRQRISPEGSIRVEQLGPIYLNGLTIAEANDRMRRIFAQKYAGVLGEDPASDIRVTLGDIRSISVDILGEVRTPGTYRLSAFASLFHALYHAGGVTDIGSLRDIRVMRDGRPLLSADLYEYLFDGKTSVDVRLQEGDVIIVPPYDIQVAVQGRVKRPMYYEMKPGEPLAALLAYAGGFAGDAYAQEVGVVRQTGRDRRFFSVDGERYGTFLLEDGDSVQVGAAPNRFANRVEARGALLRPGMYELDSQTNSVRSLIERAGGLQEDAFRNRARLLREKEDRTTEMLALDLEGLLSGRLPDVRLRPNDVLEVASLLELQEFGALTIEGPVAWPGSYPYADRTTVEDLILQAGGLLESASTAQVEVMRRIRDPRSTRPSEQIGTVYRFPIREGLVVEGGEQFLLEPFDVVVVRRSPAYRPQQLVTVEGEVLFGGRYALTHKNERLSEVIARAGGVTPGAYLQGGRLIRRMNAEEQAIREAAIRAARLQHGGDSLVLDRLTVQPDYAVGIDLVRALEDPGSDYDVILREGDRLIVPQCVSTVTVNGQVMNPTTTTFVAGKPLRYYIDRAGGYGDRAKRRRAYVVYMNGMIARAASRAPIEPGCEIIVPGKRKRNALRLGEVLGLTTSATSLAAMVTAISK